MHASTLVLLSAVLVAQQPDHLPFIKEHVKTMTYYYKSPDPALGPRALKSLLKKENIEHPWFTNKDHVLNLIGSQLGDMVTGKPRLVRAYEEEFVAAPLMGRRVIVRALTNCGDDQTVKQIDTWLANERLANVHKDLKALKKHLEDPKRKHVRDQLAREPKDLDLLWANFFITGEYAPIARILDVFDLPDARENVVLKRVARWSFESNLKQHPKLVEVVKKHARDRQKGSRKVIDDVMTKFKP